MLRFGSLLSLALASILGAGCDVSPSVHPARAVPAAKGEPLKVEAIKSDTRYRLVYTSDAGIEYYARKSDGQQRVGESILQTGGRTLFFVGIKDGEILDIFSQPSADNRHIAEKVGGIADW